MARLWPVLSGIITFGASTVDVFAQPTPDNGTSPGPALGFSCKMGKQHELDDVEAGTGALDLLNLRGHYTPGNSASPYYPNVRPMRPFTLTGTYSSTTYPLFSGFIERFPTRFDGKYARSATVLIDGLSKLAKTPLPSAADGECRLDNPLWLYRFDEPSSSTSAGDSISPGIHPPATIVASKHGAGTVTFGQATPFADGSTGVKFDNGLTTGAAYVPASALCLAYNKRTNVPFVPTSGGWMLEVWAVTPSVAPASFVSIMLQSSENGQAIEIELFNNGLQFYLGNAGLPAGGGFVSGNFCDGRLHHLVFGLRSDNKTTDIYIDGGYIGAIAAPSALAFDQLAYHTLGARVSGNQQGSQFAGTLLRYACYPGTLSAARVAAHYNAGKTGFAGETSGTRIGRLLDYAGWPAPKRTLQTGDSTMGAALIAGVDAFTAIKAVAATELGLLFVDGSGNVVFRSRSDRWTRTTAAYVLGDDSGGLNNLLSLENFSFEGGTTGTWAPGGSAPPTLSNSTAHPQVGTKGMLITWATGGSFPQAAVNVSGCVIGRTYTASAYVYVPTGSPNVQLTIAGVTSGTQTAVKDALARISVTWTATATTHSLQIWPATAPTAGQQCWADAVLVEDGFSPSSVGMEIPFDPDVEFDDDPALLINDITVSREGGATVRAVDATSVADYGNSGTTRTSNANTDAEATDQANWLIGQFKDPKLRIAKLRIDPGANPTLFPQALAMQMGDRVTVHRRSAQPDITGDYFIESKEISEDAQSFYVDLALNPADSPHALLWDVDVWDDPNAGWGF